MICTGCHPERERGTWRGVWRASRATLAPSFLATLGMTFGMACASARDPGTSSAPAAPWTAPASAVPPALPKDEVAAAGGPLTLIGAIDIALANNPATRTTWLQARAAQAALGSARSAYYPELDLNASYNRSRQAIQGGLSIFKSTTFGPSLALTYLLFDFGGREAVVEEARQTLISADFTHNRQIQNVVLQTQQAFYGYLDAKALVDAQAATLKERQASLDAADARHNAGVATIADVLQARTAFSQAQLTYETLEQNLRVFEGTLATAMGVGVTTHFDIGVLPADVPMQIVTTAVDQLIAQAETLRPDFAAARALVQRSDARISEVRAQGLPTFGLTANAARTTFHGVTNTTVSPYSVAIAMRFPLFTGFRTQYDLREARIQADIARENARSLRQEIDLQVWNSYYALSTAAQRVRTTRDFLSAAQQSADVAAGRYHDGVGSILDLLTAEAALETARAQEVQARADWFVAVAQLAYDTGALGSGETGQ
jgi:outer membrane protein